MRNVGVIFRREFTSYFNSPIAYIFIISFLLVATLFQMLGFFLVGQASMRNFFTPYLPFVLVLFIPAISMRLWAAEHRQGTFELLMTLPAQPHEVMLGKYLAALALYAVTLVCTFPLVVMVNALGNPDNGAILSGYVGLFLLGACFLAVGIFTSGLMRDQFPAFILGMLACFVMLILGTDFVASVIDGWFDQINLGSTLQQYLGMFNHYDPMLRGVLALGDVVYFLALTLLFLALNALWLEGRKY
jgi:ABC-2 type transport system permease protein